MTDLLTDSVKSDIRKAIINKKANACPMAVRLAWHASGTFKEADGTGGSMHAGMRFEPESTDGANAGLNIMRDMLIPVKDEHPEINTGDIWTLAGAAAVEFCGGPSIDHKICRKDCAGPGSQVVENGRLPDATQGAQHLRDVFYRMGFNDKDIVVLSGAHTLGRCHPKRSGFDGPWTSNPLKFDNEYYVNLLKKTWTPSKRTGPDGPMQYEDETGELMMLPTDLALRDDPAFRPFVEKYAQDEQAFFDDFAVAFSRLLALGTPHCPVVHSKQEKDASALFRDQAMHGSLAKVKELQPRADVHEVEGFSGRTALHKAAFWGHDDVVEYLIKDCKLNFNQQDNSGDTPLHDAARFGHKAVVEQLVAAGANKALKNNKGQNAIDVANAYQKPEIAAMLSK